MSAHADKEGAGGDYKSASIQTYDRIKGAVKFVDISNPDAFDLQTNALSG